MKTIIVIQPAIAHTYSSCQPHDLNNNQCFEILGFDVLLNDNLKPYLLEVNHSPSFSTESKLDYVIKHRVIAEALLLMDIGVDQKRKDIRVQRDLTRKRMTGERSFQATRQVVERKKIRNAGQRDQYEDQAKVGYIKLFPCQNTVYDKYLEASRSLWETATVRPQRAKSYQLRSSNRLVES